MTTKTYEEFMSEINSMNIKEALENAEKCLEAFTVEDIVEKQQEIINRQKAEIESLKNDLAKEFTCFVGSPHKVDHCPFFDELEKERAEALEEFAERFLKKVHDNHYMLSDQINSKHYGMFTIGIEQAVNETKREMIGEL